jgi:hypothetical protein
MHERYCNPEYLVIEIYRALPPRHRSLDTHQNKNANSADVRCLTRASTKAQRKRLSTSKVFTLQYIQYYMIVAGIIVCPIRKAAAANEFLILGSKCVL